MALIGVTGFVLWSGRAVERSAALLNAMNWFLNTLLEPARTRAADAFPWTDFIVDLIFALLFVALSLRAGRGWMALMSACLILGVANHLSYLFDRSLFQRAFVTASYVWAYGALVCLIYAGWSARRARRTQATLPG